MGQPSVPQAVAARDVEIAARPFTGVTGKRRGWKMATCSCEFAAVCEGKPMDSSELRALRAFDPLPFRARYSGNMSGRVPR
jgi:hypothetical protein